MNRSKDKRPENITDLRQLRKERSRRRARKRLGIFLVILAAGWIIFSGVQGFFRGNYIQRINSFLAMYLPGDGYPIEVAGADVLDLQNAEGDLAVVGQSRVVYYNPNGRTVEEIRHNFYNVEAVCRRAQTLLYDAGGNDLTVYSGSDPVFEQSFERTIYCADLSEGGALAVGTRSDTHTSMVTVYNSAFEEIYEWYSARGYVLDLCLPASGNRMAAATLDVSDGRLVSTVNLFDFTNAEEVKRVELADELVIDMTIMGVDNNLYVLTDRALHEISMSAGTVLNSYSFADQGLGAYRFDDGIITLAIGDYVGQRSLTIMRFTEGLADAPSAVCSDHLIDIRSDRSHTYLLTDNQLEVYDSSMQLLTVIETPDASAIELIGDDVYYLTGVSLEKIAHANRVAE